MTAETRQKKGPIAWMAMNPVAANLLMLLAVLGGGLGLFGMKQEVFPEFELDVVSVVVRYPGASPEEMERGVVLAVEEAVRGIEGVRRVDSIAAEGMATVNAQLMLGAEPTEVAADVESAIDLIRTFPEESEEPEVTLASRKRPVISLVISGEHPPATLHQVAERARARLLGMEGVTQVDLFGVRPLELSVEVSRETLEAHGLTLESIAEKIRGASVELAGGSLEADSGDVLVRMFDRRLTEEEFADIIIHSGPAGEEVRLGDVGEIRNGYAETDERSSFDGHPAVRLTAYRVGKETPSGVANAVRAYAEELRLELGDSFTVELWNDDSEMLEARIDLLVRNAWSGLLLVVGVLGLFLRRRLALWVAAGIPISFLGAFMLMGNLGVSINMISLFALIITLGMVVDDAIIVAENIHEWRASGMSPIQAAIAGAREMAVPVLFSTLTTVAAFAPLLFVPGVMGNIMRIIPLVVISVLGVSLVECFFVLPAHLAHESRKERRFAWTAPFDWLQGHVDAGLSRMVEKVYRPGLGFFLRWRHATIAMGVVSLMVCFAAIKSGLVPFRFLPALEGDIVVASVRLPYGATVERTQEAAIALEEAAKRVLRDNGGPTIARGILTDLGRGPQGRGPNAGPAETGSHLATVQLALIPSAERSVSSEHLAHAWRSELPALPGVEALSISSATGPGAGAAVDVRLSHQRDDVLEQSSRVLAETLRGHASLVDVQNDYASGKRQLSYRLREEARGLGLTSASVGRALRASLFGVEALREQRGRNELVAMVRLPERERKSEHDLAQIHVRSSHGAFVPLEYVADFEQGKSATSIHREDGKRSINVSAELAAGQASPRPVLDSLRTTILPSLEQRFPGLETSLVGERRERNESFAALGPNYVFALFAIFALLAVPFRSYLQPFIVMSAIPFGVLGAVAGHVVMGYELSFISVMGIIALSGVVVNDSLVLVDGINRYRRKGFGLTEAVIHGSTRRLRPILLTSLTTFFGLVPMIFETSPQARFLIPMAISLGFGSLAVSVIALILVPCLYLVTEDCRALAGRDPTCPGKQVARAPG